MSDPSQVDHLLKEGINAARRGDKEEARKLLQQVVEFDQYNEMGWFWLASVVETDEERRTCLGNVVLINPDNTKAQQLLERLESTAAGDSIATRLDPSKRKIFVGVAIGAALVVVICIFIVLASLGGDDDSEVAEATATNTLPPTNTLSPEELSLTPPPSATYTASFTPSPTPTATGTPTVTFTPSVPPPPDTTTGRLLVISGDSLFDEEYQEVYVMPINDPQALVPATQNNLRGYSASFAPDGRRYVYSQFNTGQRNVTIQVLNLDGSESRTITEFWGSEPKMSFVDMPAWSPNTQRDIIAFVGRKLLGGRYDDLYVVELLDEVPPTPMPSDDGQPVDEYVSPLRQLTEDAITEMWPVWSPLADEILYVGDARSAPSSGEDAVEIDGVELMIINAQGGLPSPLTDDGMAVVESSPDWGGPSNNLVIYSATTDDTPGSDIWILALDDTPVCDTGDSSTGPCRLFDFGTNDVQPLWSPDGRFIAFASDRFGEEFDIFIYEYETGEVFALTNQPEIIDVASDWISP